MALEGQVLHGRYRVESEVDRGGMATIFRAQDLALGARLVALKRVEYSRGERGAGSEALRQFEAEALLLSRLDHPGLVGVVDFFVEQGSGFLVMPYIHGRTLQSVVAQASPLLPIPAVLSIAERVLEVLEFLHLQRPPVLFRDLKPSNIMLDANGHLRLIDFGLSRIEDDGQRTARLLQGAGTPGYSPPEQYTGHTDPRSDLYAFGATLYTLVTRQVPPPSVSLLTRDARLIPPAEINANTPDTLQSLILHCMALRREDRPGSTADVRAVLEQLLTPEVNAFRLRSLLDTDGGGAEVEGAGGRGAEGAAGQRIQGECPFCCAPTGDTQASHCSDCGGRLPSPADGGSSPAVGDSSALSPGLPDAPTILAGRPPSPQPLCRWIPDAARWFSKGLQRLRSRPMRAGLLRPGRLLASEGTRRVVLSIVLVVALAAALWEGLPRVVARNPCAEVTEFLDACEAQDAGRALQRLAGPLRDEMRDRLDDGLHHEIRLTDRRVDVISEGRDESVLRVSFAGRYRTGSTWRELSSRTWSIRAERSGARWVLLDLPWPSFEVDDRGPGWIRLWEGHLLGLSPGKDRDDVWISLKKLRSAAFRLPLTETGSSRFASARANWAFFKALMRAAKDNAESGGRKPFPTDGTIHCDGAWFRVIPGTVSRIVTIEILERPGVLAETAVIDVEEYDRVQQLIDQVDRQVGARP